LWAKRQEDFDAVLAPIGDPAIARAAIKPGERIIDVGCGCGTTTLALARQTGPAGHVLGIDISKPMLARAAGRVEPGQPVEFVEADASTYAFPDAAYDVLFSRVGIMFFPDPTLAFSNMRKALRSGGRISLACFRTPQESPYLMVPLAAAHKHIAPAPRPGPEEPGMFSFASEERVRRILGAAGFQSVGLEALDVDIDIAGGRGLDTAVETALELGPIVRMLLEHPAEVRKAVASSLRDALAPYERDGGVRLRGGIWIVKRCPCGAACTASARR